MMYILNGSQLEPLEDRSFSSLEMKESDIEEFVRKNISIIFSGEDEKSLIIVGQQVINSQRGRCDLVALDSDGNLVLIEIKRDLVDIVQRKEDFEFQAIRYAANFATIKNVNELIQNIYAPYIEKHIDEYSDISNLSPKEYARRKIDSFFELNNISYSSFNLKQRIVLIAGDYDVNTLSSVAWLNSNNVDISCYRLIPIKYQEQIFIDVKRILPLDRYDDFYVEINKKESTPSRASSNNSRSMLPRLQKLMEWNVVKSGDIFFAKNRSENEAELLPDGNVKPIKPLEKEPMSLLQWLKSIYSWSAVDTYVFTIDKRSGKSLSELRKEKMDEIENQELRE